MLVYIWKLHNDCHTAVTPFNPESPFNKRALSLLEPAAGIPVMSTLSDYTRHIQNILGPMTSSILDLNPLINYWISDILHIPPTWKNVLLIIRLLNLDDLAQRMESYLSGAMKEISPVRGKRNCVSNTLSDSVCLGTIMGVVCVLSFECTQEIYVLLQAMVIQKLSCVYRKK